MFTQFSRPQSDDAIKALWTGQATKPTQPPSPQRFKAPKPTFGKRKPRR